MSWASNQVQISVLLPHYCEVAWLWSRIYIFIWSRIYIFRIGVCFKKMFNEENLADVLLLKPRVVRLGLINLQQTSENLLIFFVCQKLIRVCSTELKNKMC